MQQETEILNQTDIFQQAVGLVQENQRLAREKGKAEERIKNLAKFPSENPNIVLRIDKDGELLFSNPPAQILLNDGAIKTGDRVPWEFRKMVSLAYLTQSIQSMEITVGVQTFYLQWVPLINEGYVNIYGRNITIPKKVEEKLKQATRKNELILNSVGEGICGLDLEGNTTFVNTAAIEMLGYKKGELLGKPLQAMIHHSKPDGSPYPLEDCHIYAAFKDGKVRREYNEVFWRKDGTSFPVEYVSTPIRENEKLTGVVVTFKNITVRKKAEAQTFLQYELTRIFLDSLSLENTLPRILQAIGEFMEWEISYYWEKTPESEELNCRYAWNAPCLNESDALKDFKKISFNRTFKKGTGLPGRVWDSLEPSWISDVVLDENFPRAPFAKKLGMKSGFGFPIFYKKQFKGVIEVFTRQACRPDTHLIQMMLNLGGQIGQWMRLKKAEELLDKSNSKNLD